MFICDTCKEQFNIFEDFHIHYEKTGHEKFLEMDKMEWEKSAKLISKIIDELVRKGEYQYDNDENGRLMITRKKVS